MTSDHGLEIGSPAAENRLFMLQNSSMCDQIRTDHCVAIGAIDQEGFLADSRRSVFPQALQA
jgi:hypothetical protein